MNTLKFLILALALAVVNSAKLKKSKEGSPDDIFYYLYTRSNRDDLYTLTPFDSDSVSNSNLDPGKPTFVLIHGFWTQPLESWPMDAKNALLDKFDCNVIVVDWSILAAAPYYEEAASNVYVCADQTSSYLDWLGTEIGLDFSTLHLTGHSLGGHVAGRTGYLMASGNPARVTGLDPAGPLFYDSSNDMIINPGSADFVDIIHTNAGDFADGCLGLIKPLGDVDFYPNGGDHQEGCDPNVPGGDIVDMAKSCSHNRAPEYWIESITAEEPNIFWSWQCADWATFSSGGCDYSCDSGVCLQMGLNSIEGAVDGEYYLSTAGESPFALGTSQTN